MSNIALPSESRQPATSRMWNVWTIFKQEILYLTWALMEVALLSPLVLFIMEWARFWSSAQITLWLLLLVLLPFNLVRLMSALQLPKKHQWRIAFIALLITCFINWRVLLFPSITFFDLGWVGQIVSNFAESGSELWTRILTLFFVIVFTWWRGFGLINLKADVQMVGSRLRVGILLFIPLALLPDQRPDVWGMMPFVLLFVLSGLTAISLIRAEQVEKDRSGFSASLSPRWVATIFLTSFLIILISGLFAIIVGGEIAGLISDWFSPLKTAFWFNIAAILGTIFFLATPLFFLFNQMLLLLTSLISAIFLNISERLNITLPANLAELGSLFPSSEEAIQPASLAIPDIISRLFVLGVMLLIVFIVSLALTRRFRNAIFAPRKEGKIPQVEVGKLDSQPLAQRLLHRLGLLRQWRSAASVRNIYRKMCQAASSVGYPRAETETPYEYLQSLSKVWPGGQAESRLITEAFVRVRYGEIPETDEEMQIIHEAWQKLEQTKPDS